MLGRGINTPKSWGGSWGDPTGVGPRYNTGVPTRSQGVFFHCICNEGCSWGSPFFPTWSGCGNVVSIANELDHVGSAPKVRWFYLGVSLFGSRGPPTPSSS